VTVTLKRIDESRPKMPLGPFLLSQESLAEIAEDLTALAEHDPPKWTFTARTSNKMRYESDNLSELSSVVGRIREFEIEESPYGASFSIGRDERPRIYAVSMIHDAALTLHARGALQQLANTLCRHRRRFWWLMRKPVVVLVIMVIAAAGLVSSRYVHGSLASSVQAGVVLGFDALSIPIYVSVFRGLTRIEVRPRAEMAWQASRDPVSWVSLFIGVAGLIFAVALALATHGK
jgi:hypothetical protein